MWRNCVTDQVNDSIFPLLFPVMSLFCSERDYLCFSEKRLYRHRFTTETRSSVLLWLCHGDFREKVCHKCIKAVQKEQLEDF